MKVIAHSKLLFYFLHFTWGLLVNLIGFLVFLVLLPFSKGHAYYHNCFYTRVFHNWGGLSIGLFIFTDAEPCVETDNHESGHSLQASILGIFYIFVVLIPSAIRYNYFMYLIRSRKKDWDDLPSYDSIWFEGQATRWGTFMYK